jgi:hypothetical protein
MDKLPPPLDKELPKGLDWPAEGGIVIVRPE